MDRPLEIKKIIIMSVLTQDSSKRGKGRFLLIYCKITPYQRQNIRLEDTKELEKRVSNLVF